MDAHMCSAKVIGVDYECTYQFGKNYQYGLWAHICVYHLFCVLYYDSEFELNKTFNVKK